MPISRCPRSSFRQVPIGSCRTPCALADAHQPGRLGSHQQARSVTRALALGTVGARPRPPSRSAGVTPRTPARTTWCSTLDAAAKRRTLPAALPEPAGSSGTERNSADFDRAEALERVAVRRQHLSFRSPLSYFHDGSAATLAVVLRDQGTVHGMSELATQLTDAQISDLTAFLQSL